ncbi:LysR family transcriptional regulator ArgP [Rubrivivax gelatinosus]|uniref:ArgP/LysG family DNA-binding transcriptional regulator n=1 Tax=Rubrivivax gelatinosus TaxID=28068 RepID=A0ABS1DQN0_RUBGE|nr:LysR family transcriptional regulator ArgP [Rubrivivax gelatinosus]MBK1712266.1 ArgP/LysG family DNA-binding transcriptional regulator [Rubrivivax gelatinosus]
MLDYALIEAVAAVVREGSFERAARTLHVSASAVSQRVRLLEERLGQVLVVRGQPCEATAAGRLLCRHAEQVALLEGGLRRELPALGAAGDWATLPVAVNADSLATWFVAAAAAFAQDEPGVLLDLSVDDQDHTAERLRAGEVLAAVSADDEAAPGCRRVPLGQLRYVATASPAFVGRHFAAGVDAAALARTPALVFDRKDRLQQRWAERVLGHGVELPRHWLPASQAFVDATLAGLGWGLNPEPLVRPLLAAGALVALVPGSELQVALAWQHARITLPALQRLTARVVEAAGAVLEP